MDYRSMSRMKKRKVFDELPSELLKNVFTRLRVKSLLKLRCVCKEWNSIIIDQDFTSLHLQRQDQQLKLHGRRSKYFLCRQGDQGEMVLRRTDSFTQDAQLNTPRMFRRPMINRVVNYVNGVLLMHLSDDEKPKIVLWNPSIRKVLEIPCFQSKGWYNNMKFGFGFDSASNTYKVVALHLVKYLTDTKVYNLRNRSWLNPKQRKTPTPTLYFTKFTMPINLDNEIYWLGSVDKKKTTSLTHFICFDFSSEAFTCIKLPDMKLDSVVADHKRCSAVLDNSLAVLDYYYVRTGLHASVWKGQKSGTSYIWTKQYNLDIKIIGNSYSSYKIELWFRNLPKGSILYNLENQESKTLSNIHWRPIKFLQRYMESLVLLGEKNVM